MADAAFLECPNCGQRIAVDAVKQPITYAQRAAALGTPRAFLMIDGDNWLLHRCSIAADEAP